MTASLSSALPDALPTPEIFAAAVHGLPPLHVPDGGASVALLGLALLGLALLSKLAFK